MNRVLYKVFNTPGGRISIDVLDSTLVSGIGCSPLGPGRFVDLI